MKILLPWICLVSLLSTIFSTQAQNQEVLFEEMIHLGPFRQFDWITEEDIEANSLIMLDVNVLGEKKLSKVIVSTPDLYFKQRARKVQIVKKQRFQSTRKGKYSFSFRNNSFLPKKAKVKVVQVLEDEFEDERMLDEIKITVFEDSIQRAKVDTVPWPDLQEIELSLSANRNPEDISYFCEEFQLLGPEEDQYAAYWVGIGEESLKAYEKIKNNPPPAWLMEGINEPLMAFGMELTRSLPVTRSTLANGIVMQVRNPSVEFDPNRLDDPYLSSSMFGIISRDRARKYNAVKICGKNLNTTSEIKVYIKIARFSLIRKVVYDRVIRERVQELFITQPVLKKPEE